MRILNKLLISNKEVWPIIEGGKGIGASDGFSSGAFAAADSVGTFSGVNARLINDHGDFVPIEYKTKTRRERHDELLSYSIEAALSHARVANILSKGRGRIHMNVLWELGGAQRLIHGILEKAKGLIHGITCGAGMPYKLAEIASQYKVYYYPIVSSVKALRILWKRSYQKLSQFLGGVVYEDPWYAGGHNGFSNEDSPDSPVPTYEKVGQIRRFMNEVGLKGVPLIVAGGLWYLRDWKQYIDNYEYSPLAFQFGSRALLTKESSISDAWKHKLLTLKKGDVVLNKFSPTGFYSSAVKNDFLSELFSRSARQIKFSDTPSEEFPHEYIYGIRRRSIYIANSDVEKVYKWNDDGFSEVLKTPDDTVIFVTEEKSKQIRVDQIGCMGCLSHCRFSNWKDHDDHNTGKKPDPRSFCIQKTLQNIIQYDDVDNELLFSGYNAYKFSEDPLYNNGIPTTKELVEAILLGN